MLEWNGRPWWCWNVPNGVAPWIYFLLFTIVAIVEWVIRDYTGQNGAMSVLRISMGTVLFFFMMMVVCIGVSPKDCTDLLESDGRIILHTGLWPYKTAIWAALVGTTFLYPEHVLEVYQYIARVFGALFMVAQTVIFIDTVFRANDALLSQESLKWKIFLISITVCLLCVSLGGIGALYYFYVPNSSCDMNIAFISSTLGLGIVYSLLSVSNWRVEHAGLFTSSMVFALNTFYTWSALNSQPMGQCTSKVDMEGDQPSDLALKILSFTIALLSMLIGTVNTARSSDAFSLEENHHYLDGDASLYRIDVFYAIYMLASGYMAMVFVGWDVAKTDEEQQWTMDKGIGSTWAKMGASWLCALLYIWTLVAPRLLGKYRNFS